MTKLSLRLFGAGLILIQVFFPSIVKAQGDLLITPRRVVLDARKRSMDLSLANIGKDTATYTISFVEIRMTEAGTFETITEPDEGQRFASPYLRFFPRSVTLSPDEVQTIKIQATRTRELETGEYRSHIYFRAVPKEKPLGEEVSVQQDPSSISIKLIPVFGITIPVIIRAGEGSAAVNLSDLPRLTEAEAREFLDSNVLTSGMEMLLSQSFARMAGTGSPSGIYKLSESMGGGKTQSMIVAGILARFPLRVATITEGAVAS